MRDPPAARLNAATHRRTSSLTSPMPAQARYGNVSAGGGALVTETEIFEQLAITIEIRSLEVLQQTAPLTHHHEQATTAGVIFLVLAKVFGEIFDASGQQRDLNWCAAAIGVVQLVLTDDFVFVESHEAQPPRETVAGREARPTMGRDSKLSS